MPSIAHKAKTFTKLPGATKLLFAEALVTSAYVKFALLFLPFRRVAAWLGKPVDINNPAPHQQEAMPLIKEVKTAINLIDKYAPWPTECYTRALTGKIMLHRRQVRSVLFIGFRRDPETKEVQGHAWLNTTGTTVTGKCDFSLYHVHSAFGDK